MKRGCAGRIARALAVCLALAGGACSETERGQQNMPLEMTFERVGKEPTIAITLQNASEGSVDFYDSLAADSDALPSFVWIKLRDESGKTLTDSKLSEDGFWSPKSLESQLLMPPVPMSTLSPNDVIEKRIQVAELLQGLGGGNAIKPDRAQIKVRARVYLDARLQRFEEFESPWL